MPHSGSALTSRFAILAAGAEFTAGLLLGYASHLALDACTVSGVPLLYPANRKCHLLPKLLRVVTSSPEEGLVFALVAGMVLARGALFPVTR
jgi:membrane-bound metal-dependent hydrolase YbcI (DUF457 family)